MALDFITKKMAASHRVLQTELPSTGAKIKFRPITGHEEKILLMAKEGDDQDEILSTVCRVIENCLIDSPVDIMEMPIFDIEWLFIQIRSESISPEAEVSYIDQSDGKRYDFKINLKEVKVVRPESPDKIVKVNDEIAFELRYPPVDAFIQPTKDTQAETAHTVAAACISAVYDGDESVDRKSARPDEFEAFLDVLPTESYDHVLKWLGATPVIEYRIKYTNTKGEEREIVLNNLTDFFRFR